MYSRVAKIHFNFFIKEGKFLECHVNFRRLVRSFVRKDRVLMTCLSVCKCHLLLERGEEEIGRVFQVQLGAAQRNILPKKDLQRCHWNVHYQHIKNFPRNFYEFTNIFVNPWKANAREIDGHLMRFLMLLLFLPFPSARGRYIDMIQKFYHAYCVITFSPFSFNLHLGLNKVCLWVVPSRFAVKHQIDNHGSFVVFFPGFKLWNSEKFRWVIND